MYHSVNVLRMMTFDDESVQTTMKHGNRIVIWWNIVVIVWKVRLLFACWFIATEVGYFLLTFWILDSAASKYCTYDHKHMHIDYYGECKDIEPCQDDILEDFPRRMRDWLDNIIR